MMGDMFLRTFSTLIVIQNAIYREGLARILPQEQFDIILKISSVDNLILKQADDLQPDLVIFNIASEDPARCDNIAALHRRWPHSRIVVFSDRHCQREIAAAVRAGVSAWIEASGPPAKPFQGMLYLRANSSMLLSLVRTMISENRSPLFCIVLWRVPLPGRGGGQDAAVRCPGRAVGSAGR